MPREIREFHPCSMRMTDLLIDTCDVVWTAKAANVVCALAGVGQFKIAADCTNIALGDSAAGSQAWSIGSCGNQDLTGGAWTHLKFWIRVTTTGSVDVAAGAFQLGLTNENDGTGTVRYVDIPALSYNTWTRVVVPLSAGPDGQTANITSLSAIHLGKSGATPDNCNIFLDDIRLVKYEPRGLAITLPTTCTLNNGYADSVNTDVWQLPYQMSRITIHELQQDADVTYYLGSVGHWAATDLVCGMDYLHDGQTGVDLEREGTSLSIILANTLQGAAYFSVLVVE